MTTPTKFFQFVEDLAKGVHNLNTGVIKFALTNSAPVTSNTIFANISEISAGNGYTAGGTAAAFTSGAQTSGTYKLVLADVVFTASGAVGPFRYPVAYNDTPTSPADPLIYFADYGTPVTLANGDTFTIDLDQSGGFLTIA